MTRSKLEFAVILSTLRGQGEDPQKLASEMTLRKLCYEIEKLEEEAALAAQPEEPPPEENKAPEKRQVPKPLWSRLNLEDSDEE